MKTLNKVMKNLTNKSLAIYCALATTPSFAGDIGGDGAGAGGGGLGNGTKALDDFTQSFYEFVGVGAGLYMLAQCAMAWGERKSWADAGMACGKVACAGGALLLAKFCWGIFTN